MLNVQPIPTPLSLLVKPFVDPTRKLTARERMFTRVFVFIARRGGAGASRRDVALYMGFKVNSPYLRAMLQEMVERGFIQAAKQVDLPRSPWGYWTTPDVWGW